MRVQNSEDMILSKFVTAKELNPITSMMLNARFNGFLVKLASRIQRKPEDLIEIAREILEDAEIPQPVDPADLK